jgi:hypothetical protein
MTLITVDANERFAPARSGSTSDLMDHVKNDAAAEKARRKLEAEIESRKLVTKPRRRGVVRSSNDRVTANS